MTTLEELRAEAGRYPTSAGLVSSELLIGEETYHRRAAEQVVGELEPHAEIFRQYVTTTTQLCVPIYRMVFKDALLTSQGAIITRDNRLIRDSCEPLLKQRLPMFGIDRKGDDKLRLSSLPTRYIETPALLAKGPWWRNYGHWIVESAALVALTRDLGQLPATFGVITGAFGGGQMQRIVEESLKIIAPDNPVLRHSDEEIWLLSELHYVGPLHVPPLFKSPHAFRALRKIVLSDLPTRQRRRVFVRRSSDNRCLLNEDEILDVCREHGFEMADPGQLGFAEQVALFDSASAVVGVKGAALVNLLFCREETPVVVLSPADFSDAFFWEIAGQLQMRYSEVFGPPASRDKPTARNPFTIDKEQFSRTLAWACGQSVNQKDGNSLKHGHPPRGASLTAVSNLDEIGLQEGTDKSSSHHNYLSFYERFLAELKMADRLSILEIGVANGASVRTWARYFPNATIVGVDRTSSAAVHATEQIKVEIADQSDLDELVRIAREHGPFDLVIDDGSHICDHQILSFQALYPHVKRGGFFILEDIDTSFVMEKYRGLAEISAFEYLQRFCSLLVADTAVDISREKDPFLRAYARRTEFIAFYRRTSLIRRKL